MTSLATLTSTQELSSLDKTMEELQISLADIEEVAPPPITVTTPGATEMPVLEITAQAEGDKLKEEEEEEPKTEVLTDEATDDESESEDGEEREGGRRAEKHNCIIGEARGGRRPTVM